ncbi:outer membrane protein [Sphingomonas canadensis]|uniref:Outer membrane protein n=1 Tax=Sphingomonas canadensis TaxID=1219257 RepID=A0ABW3H6E4_9SPHN|nr:outer membrane beta-barrel protein [Sphingomonas canadensis]MCW3835232.1 outer membrane beta-barrel protein [Sphingomonas canadensis]
MRIAILAASAAAIAFAAPAHAQDGDKSFTGPRVEGVAGWDRLDDGGTAGVAASDGFTYGVQLGYDYDLGKAVIGVEGEVADSTNKETASGVLAAGDTLSVKAGRDLYAGVRVGFKAGGSTLIYAKGGYTNARINTLYTAPATSVSAKDDLDGWRLGAGVERQISGNVYVKGEYRYSNYDKLSGYAVDIDRHQVVAGVGVRF